MDAKIWNKLIINILGFFLVYTKGEIRIEVPVAGNCGDDTLLECHFTGQLGTPVGWTVGGRKMMHNGGVVRPEDAGKYTEKRDQIDQGFVTLVIHNTARSDEVKYGCSIGFDQTAYPEDRDKYLNFECKASSTEREVTRGKQFQLIVDKLYPSSSRFLVLILNMTRAITVSGSKKCSSSTKYTGYFKCVWTSSNSLADGSYTYSLVVTTITKSNPLSGDFKIVSPQTPAILNVVNIEDNKEVVFGNEGQSLTIQCTSSGGYPAPSVVWYKDRISSSNQLPSTNTEILQGDGTYTVTLKHTFTLTTLDDRKPFICRSYYPQADSVYTGSKTKSVILYLTLKPNQPTVRQRAVTFTGDTVEVGCRTTGCRPAANISWSYKGSTTTGEVTVALEKTTETYTVMSVFRQKVTAADNGQTVQCIVTHQALISPSEKTASVNLNISFSAGPSTTHITGNKELIATGKTTLKLTCTTGSSNPASDIRWKNGSITLTNSRHFTESVGDNNGVVRSQQLVLYPTRYMDGNDILCLVSNKGSQSNVEDTITLNLKYRPLIAPMSEIIAVEGNTTVLTCVASSKPASTFKWYREGQSGILHQRTGTLDNNKLTYIISNVRRTDAAKYRCNAKNGIEAADNANVLLTVYYPPDVTAVTTNTTVKSSTALIKCNARGVPNRDYKYGKWIQTWPDYNVPVSERPGSEKLVLTNLTYEHSGVYTCSASNGVQVFGTNKEYLEGSDYLLVKCKCIF
ncbi:hemicentin-2-like [Mercenaria mercenaria]|uniref:hemicentin-2-like n=1 Tax=Mercenaria mercenaria TaxID=6596 RepID=UPI00234E6B87|nr:hemicentin-2-like [Mercenaria mercenaria]